MKFDIKKYVKNGIASTVVFITTVILALIFYVVVLARHEQFWAFNTIFYLCFITFALGVGILISALLKEKALQDSVEQ